MSDYPEMLQSTGLTANGFKIFLLWPSDKHPSYMFKLTVEKIAKVINPLAPGTVHSNFDHTPYVTDSLRLEVAQLREAITAKNEQLVYDKNIIDALKLENQNLKQRLNQEAFSHSETKVALKQQNDLTHAIDADRKKELDCKDSVIRQLEHGLREIGDMARQLGQGTV
jgi:regulator of replication initiation timing